LLADGFYRRRTGGILLAMMKKEAGSAVASPAVTGASPCVF
jgi:hypothetical protein